MERFEPVEVEFKEPEKTEPERMPARCSVPGCCGIAVIKVQAEGKEPSYVCRHHGQPTLSV